jgi:Glyoxalase/Bleomycin resistance protein/Dioxygenase superfamily
MPLWNWGQPLNGIIQIAFIVEDIQAAMPIYQKRLNIGPWYLFEHFAFKYLKYRGEESKLDITLALGNSGHMMFELIQQNDDLPSVYKDVQKARGWGFHHFAVAAKPDEYDSVVKEYQAQGYGLALDGAVAVGARAAYLDTLSDLPGMIEVIEVTPAVEGLFTHIHQASVGWDGTDPVRVLPPPGASGA